jgi:hypothetical protein
MTACLLFVLLFLTQNPAKKPGGGDTQSQNNTDSLREAHVPLTVNCNQSTGAVVDNNRQETPERDAAVQWFNWALVIVAAITGLVIWLQTKATRKAAETALLNAQAYMDAERPWLLIETQEDGWSIGPPDLTVSDLPRTGQERASFCTYHIRNYGRIPAKIIAQRSELQIGPDPRKPPKPEFYDQPGTVKPYIIPQNTIRMNIADFPSAIVTSQQKGLIFPPDPALFIWLCGFIQYRDTFGRKPPVELTTLFCFLYHCESNSWSMAGPSSYNDAT